MRQDEIIARVNAMMDRDVKQDGKPVVSLLSEPDDEASVREPVRVVGNGTPAKSVATTIKQHKV